jgi:hypothetical protein
MKLKVIKKEDSVTLWMLLYLPFLTFLDRKYGRGNVFQSNLSKSFLGRAKVVQKGFNLMVNDEPVACVPESGPLFKEHLFLVKKDLAEEFLGYVNAAVEPEEVMRCKTAPAAEELRKRINEHMLKANIAKYQPKGELQ